MRRFWYFGKRSATDTDVKETINSKAFSTVLTKDVSFMLNFSAETENKFHGGISYFLLLLLPTGFAIRNVIYNV